jgi:ribosomal protein S12 methylthiotransferase accessory factor
MSDEAAVGVVGDGPAVEAVLAAPADDERGGTRTDVDAVASFELAVVVALAGADRFDQVQAARSAPWIAVELGGIGCHGIDGLDAAVSVPDPG